MVSTSKSAARQALARKSFTQLPIPMLKYGLDISTNIALFDFDAIAAQSASENVVSTNETLGNGVVFVTSPPLNPFFHW